jgi:FkbM family methyltransferase
MSIVKGVLLPGVLFLGFIIFAHINNLPQTRSNGDIVPQTTITKSLKGQANQYGIKQLQKGDGKASSSIQSYQILRTNFRIVTAGGRGRGRGSASDVTNEWHKWDCYTAALMGDQDDTTITSRECDWVKFLPYNSQNNVDMCIVPGNGNDVFVSGSVRTEGRWSECDNITKLMIDYSSYDAEEGGIYIDIGTNIGTCLLQALTTLPNLDVASFEPDPGNQFYVTSTLSKLSNSMKDRISFFPIALGERTDIASIFVDTKNRGNSIVTSNTTESLNSMFGESYFPPVTNIYVEPLDGIIQYIDRTDDTNDNNNKINYGIQNDPHQNEKYTPKINFLKIDAQGYECFIIPGMATLLQQRVIEQIWYEVEPAMLVRNNCSHDFIFMTLQKYGYYQYTYPPHQDSAITTNVPSDLSSNIWASLNPINNDHKLSKNNWNWLT